jgi:hypothetical protein
MNRKGKERKREKREKKKESTGFSQKPEMHINSDT